MTSAEHLSKTSSVVEASQNRYPKAWLFALLVFLFAAWLACVFIWPVTFWGSYDEYAYLALADASNFDVWLRTGTHFSDTDLGTHPGLPYYVVSWICLKLTTLLAGQTDSLSYVFHDPEPFFLATRIAALTILSGSILFAWRVLSFLAPSQRALALATFLVADGWSVIYGATIFASETFALPVAVLTFWCVRRLDDSDVRTSQPWAVCGAVAAIGYLVKLTYIFVLAGFLVAAIVTAISLHSTAQARIRFAASRAAIIMAAFLTISAVCLLVIAGSDETRGLLQVHAGFLFHTYLPQGGYGTSLSLDTMGETLRRLGTTSAIIPLTVLALAACIFQMARTSARDVFMLRWLWVSFATLFLTFLAVLNHFQFYYVPAVSAILPFAFAPLLKQSRKAMIFVPVALCAAAISIFGVVTQYTAMHNRSQAIATDERLITSMPLAPGEARLWTYRIPSRHFVLEMLLQFAGLQDYFHKISPVGQEISSYAAIDRNYRYVVLDRAYYPTAASVRQSEQKGPLIEPNGMRSK